MIDDPCTRNSGTSQNSLSHPESKQVLHKNHAGRREQNPHKDLIFFVKISFTTAL
jgi:hypothetical protein